MRETLQRQRIPLGSKPRDHAVGAKRYIGVVAEFLALVDVRYVNFDDGRLEGIQCVEDRNRRMGKRSRIDHDAACSFSLSEAKLSSPFQRLDRKTGRFIDAIENPQASKNTVSRSP